MALTTQISVVSYWHPDFPVLVASILIVSDQIVGIVAYRWVLLLILTHLILGNSWLLSRLSHETYPIS